MYMAYTTNPHLPRVRAQAVELVQQGWSTRKVAHRVGYDHSTIVRWSKRVPLIGRREIPTLSSRPHSHPRALPPEIVEAILEKRKKRNRCAEVVHQELLRDDISVSLSSVKRTLKRYGLIKRRSPWKRWHFSTPRPLASNPGSLVQIDTIHVGPCDKKRLYVYTMIDVYSRYAWAYVTQRINTHKSLSFVKRSQGTTPFVFSTLQSDHGPEFSTYFTEHIQKTGTVHRHSRVRKPNDNAHVERFNRTVQDECTSRLPRRIDVYQRELKDYLHYYNTERLHMSLNFETPCEVVQRY